MICMKKVWVTRFYSCHRLFFSRYVLCLLLLQLPRGSLNLESLVHTLFLFSIKTETACCISCCHSSRANSLCSFSPSSLRTEVMKLSQTKLCCCLVNVCFWELRESGNLAFNYQLIPQLPFASNIPNLVTEIKDSGDTVLHNENETSESIHLPSSKNHVNDCVLFIPDWRKLRRKYRNGKCPVLSAASWVIWLNWWGTCC